MFLGSISNIEFNNCINVLLGYVTKENITFIIALIGFILSIYNFVHERLQNRMKLKIIYKNHGISEYDSSGITIAMAIENHVAQPISVTRMFLNINDVSIEFYWIPQIVFSSELKQKERILASTNVHSIELPTIIEGYGVLGGFFYTKYPTTITNKFLKDAKTSITVHTNKGKKTYEINLNNTDRER